MRTIAKIMAVAWVVVGCSSSDTTTSNASGRGSLGACYGTEGQTCTGVDTFESCLESHCDSQAKACYGSGYKSGNFSGPCGPFISCISQCNCGDTTCQSGCLGKLTNDCQTWE